MQRKHNPSALISLLKCGPKFLLHHFCLVCLAPFLTLLTHLVWWKPIFCCCANSLPHVLLPLLKIYLLCLLTKLHVNSLSTLMVTCIKKLYHPYSKQKGIFFSSSQLDSQPLKKARMEFSSSLSFTFVEEPNGEDRFFNNIDGVSPAGVAGSKLPHQPQ
jgi:hypothetical protein